MATTIQIQDEEWQTIDSHIQRKKKILKIRTITKNDVVRSYHQLIKKFNLQKKLDEIIKEETKQKKPKNDKSKRLD